MDQLAEPERDERRKNRCQEAQARFAGGVSANVVYSRQAADYIRSFTTPMIRVSQVADVAAAIQSWDDAVGEEQRAAHVDNLRQRHAATRAGAAPRRG